MQVVKPSAAAANLLGNGDFEQGEGTRVPSWNRQLDGCTLVSGTGRHQSQGLSCDAQSRRGSFGAGQTIAFSSTNLSPLVVRGWSRAQDVDGRPDSGYSVYVDIVYADGTPLWGQTANFHTGSHDWEARELVLIPEKPLQRLSVYALFRGHTGKVWFDDFSVEQIEPGSGAALFDGTPMVLRPVRSGSESSNSYQTQDGFDLQMRGTDVAALSIDKQHLATSASGGFLVRDVAAGSDVFGFVNGECAELGLKLKTEIAAHTNYVSVSGRLSDITGRDRAVTLFFAIPLEATGWRWGDDIRRSRVIAGSREFSNTVRVGCGATGTMSLYPLAAIYNEKHGLAMALDMGQPALYRLAFNASTGQFYIAFDFGLVPETERFPHSADFRFVLFRFEPLWGFRGAFQKLMEIFSDYFRVRSSEQGIWMPFTDISKVEGWENFGFKYHEGNNNVPWDAAHGVLSFRYTEPMTWWMRMPNEAPRTVPEALRIRDQWAADRDAADHHLAQVSKVAAMQDDSAQPSLQFKNEPWCNGAVWSLNPNPFLASTSNGTNTPSAGESLNAATVHWNDAIKEKLYGPSAKGRLAGEYLDSLEGYTTADLNFRREHFRFSAVPLAFDSETKRPALYKGLAVYEFTRWFCDDVHRLGKLTFANGVPYRFTFLCPWLDVLGTETDWLAAGKYHPVSDSQMNLWRTMAGRKPYLLLMNTDFDAFTPEMVERYFQRSLFYGMFPSMFSHNAADNPYWQNPKWYNRDRPLFKKYLPLIRRVAEAGWQPVTAAHSDNPNIWVERFGPDKTGAVYFTLFNDTGEPQSAKLELDRSLLSLPKGVTLQHLLPGASSDEETNARVTLAPQSVQVLVTASF